MIFAKFSGAVTPIALTLMLLVYLLIIELGDRDKREVLIPFIIAIGAVFVLVVILNIWSKL